MVSRTLATCALVLFVALVTVQASSKHAENELKIFKDKPHSLYLGQRISGDSLLDSSLVFVKPRHFRWVMRSYTFPSQTANNKDNFITNVVVNNLAKDGKSGYPVLKHGGPGSPDVTINLLSNWNKGIAFAIEVYGFKKDQ